MQTIADKIIYFNSTLHFDETLPPGFAVLNPFLDNPQTMSAMEQFYKKYYSDNNKRKFLMGINPSRHGAGVTGVPFTDTKRLASVCGITMKSARTHEPSSVFIYDMIEAYGGPEIFYKNVYINSPFPLVIVRNSKSGTWLNANYYDDPALFEALQPYMLATLKRHIAIGVNTDEVYVLGKKNAQFLEKLQEQERLFDRLVVLDHPRFIEQYKRKEKDRYIAEYLEAFQ